MSNILLTPHTLAPLPRKEYAPQAIPAANIKIEASKGASDPILVTTGNFLRAAPFAVALSLIFVNRANLGGNGFWYAIVSGVLTSAIGYAIWYAALPHLKATTAATLQLSVPILAALGGIAFLSEPPNLRLVLTAVVILGGIALVILEKKK